MDVSIKHFLGPRGRLFRAGMSFRPEQLEMAESVEEAINAQKPLLIEAGTGVGKSLAYLLPAALAAVRDKIHILVSTHTKALQEQLVRKDLPFLSDALSAEHLPFSFALFMGSENYLCLRRFHQAIRDSDALFSNPGHIESLQRLNAFADSHPVKSGQSGLRTDLPDAPDDVWRNISRESDNCMSAKSPFYHQCYHHAAQTRMKAADILVVNHALFFSNIAAGGRVLPAYDVAILDEAHSVEEVAASHLGLQITNFSVRWQIDQIHHPETERGLALRFVSPGAAWRRGVMDLSRKLRRQSDEFFDSILAAVRPASETWAPPTLGAPGALVRRSPSNSLFAVRVRKPGLVPNSLSRRLDELAEHLRDGRDRLESPEDKQELKAYADRLTHLAAGLDNFLTQSDRMMVYWVEIEKRARGTRVKLCAAPVDLSRVLKAALFGDDGPTAILTSATLTVKDEFDFVASRIGAQGVTGISLGSPFDYPRQCLLYLPPAMPDVADEEPYYRAVEEETRKLIEISGGGAFVLCTSHDWVNRLHRSLSEKLADYYFLKQGGPKSFEILSEFRQRDRAVLIGTDTFWQGVDVPGEALRLVIVTRLPFATPSHPLEEAKLEFLRHAGFDPFTRHTLPAAVLMLRQGFGRLIRRQDDRGVVAILDPRLKTRMYGPVFLKSLPPAKQTTRIEDVKRFFQT